MELTTIDSSQSTNLHSAWLLATLGSKTSSRNRLIKRDNLLSLSIPKLCDSILQSQKDRPIRWLGNIMHGVSIIYNSKINYFLQDLNYVQMRLKNTSSMNVSIVQHTKRKGDGYLLDDPRFDINQDMVRMESNDDPEIKRRKLGIQQDDLRNFPNFTLDHQSLSGPFRIEYELRDDIYEFDLDDFMVEQYELPQVDFEIDLNHENDENMIDFVDEIDNIEPVLREERIIQGSISNDANFALSTEQTPVLVRPKLARLIIDEQNELPTSELTSLAQQYESRMSKSIVNNQQVYSGMYYTNIPFIEYVQQLTTNRGSNITLNSTTLNTTTIHSILQDSLHRDSRNVGIFQRVEHVDPEQIDEQIRNVSVDPYNEEIDDYNMVEFDFDHEEQDFSQHHQTLDDTSDLSLDNDTLNTKLNKFLKYLIKQCGSSTKISFSTLVPHQSNNIETVNKRVAINSFASILTLASKNYINIVQEQSEPFKLLKPNQINIVLKTSTNE